VGDVRKRLKALYRAYELDQDPSLTLLRSEARFVPGVGSETDGVVFVGEAPGKAEDLARKPFVGRSGKLLDRLLASIGLDRDGVYITNVVKYRPPDNRDPLPTEIKASLPYLRREISILGPRLVVPLGRFATWTFLPGTTMKNVVGKTFIATGFGVPVIPMYHPAVALYDPRRLSDMFEQFGLLKGAL